MMPRRQLDNGDCPGGHRPGQPQYRASPPDRRHRLSLRRRRARLSERSARPHSADQYDCYWRNLPRKNKGQRKPQPAQTVPTPSLLDPASSPNPAPGTIEFEHGQIVAKIGRRGRTSERIISPEFCFVHTPNDTPTPLPRLANASPLDVTVMSKALVF